MAGFSTVDSLITAAAAASSKMQNAWFNKQVAVVPNSNRPKTFWTAPGIPEAGANPTNGLANAVACTSSTTGAIKFTNAAGGATLHLTGFSLAPTANSGVFLLVDRLAHVNISIDQASGDISPAMDGTARLATGEGALLIAEVTSTLSGSNTVTLEYTDEGGNAGTTPAMSLTVVNVGHSPTNVSGTGNTSWIIPLAAGDLGARTVTRWNKTSGVNTGAINIVMIKPMAWIHNNAAQQATDRDYVISFPNTVKIPDNACLCLYTLTGGTATNMTLLGEVRAVEN